MPDADYNISYKIFSCIVSLLYIGILCSYFFYITIILLHLLAAIVYKSLASGWLCVISV